MSLFSSFNTMRIQVLIEAFHGLPFCPLYAQLYGILYLLKCVSILNIYLHSWGTMAHKCERQCISLWSHPLCHHTQNITSSMSDGVSLSVFLAYLKWVDQGPGVGHYNSSNRSRRKYITQKTFGNTFWLLQSEEGKTDVWSRKKVNLARCVTIQ